MGEKGGLSGTVYGKSGIWHPGQYAGGECRYPGWKVFPWGHHGGLGYLTLGQPCTTLSGGESQRIKLSSELSKRDTGRTLYILDEPTTGLHFEDIRLLLEVLNKLVDRGNTVIVIEHNLDVIKVADHIIDIGPEGGAAGGEIIVAGTPHEVAQCEGSYTGQFLKKLGL